jgi:D-alanyl-D-alanine dipeptidase
VVKKVKIVDSGSKIVGIENTKKLIVNETPAPKAREEIRNMLVKSSLLLPDNYFLYVICAYRDIETQRKYWQETIDEIKSKFPNLPSEELKRRARLWTAEPTGEGPHQTGGAVDVLLIDETKKELPMGTAYRENNEKTRMFSKFCTKKEKKGRKILRDVMIKAGFWYYPGEWWHFSYGDKMWGAYTGNKAIYGPIKIS